MKLNNKGWGTLEMLLLSGGLLLALLVSIFFISKLYNTLGKPLENKVYIDLENKLEVAGRNYIEDREISVSGTYKISLETLQESDALDELRDSNGNLCLGYVTVTNTGNNNQYKGYIKCNDYETLNY